MLAVVERDRVRQQKLFRTDRVSVFVVIGILLNPKHVIGGVCLRITHQQHIIEDEGISNFCYST